MNSIQFHDAKLIECAFKTACILHNMILDWQKNGTTADREWENVRWEDLEPTEDDSDGEDDILAEEVTQEEDAIVDPLPNLSGLTVIATPGATTPAEDVPVHVFTVATSKEDVKKVLQSSFTIQWIKHGLEWPKGMNATDRSRLPLDRATMEMFRAIHGLPSVLRAPDPTTGQHNQLVGRGLFSHMGYKYGEDIVAFVGVIRSTNEYDGLSQTDPCRKSYALYVDQHRVLDCYEHAKAGLCRASLANDPYNCWNTATNRKAVANARISVHRGPDSKVTVSIKAGRKVCRTEVAAERKRFYLPPNTEILVDYGDLYRNFDFQYYPSMEKD
jgi:hypothetical protein